MTDKEITILQRESYACLDKLEDSEIQFEKEMRKAKRKFTKILNEII